MTTPITRVRGIPGLGSTVGFLRDARGLLMDYQSIHGDAFAVKVLGQPVTVLLSPEATKEIRSTPWPASMWPWLRLDLVAPTGGVGDGFADLAIGVPSENIGTKGDAGWCKCSTGSDRFD